MIKSFLLMALLINIMYVGFSDNKCVTSEAPKRVEISKELQMELLKARVNYFKGM